MINHESFAYSPNDSRTTSLATTSPTPTTIASNLTYRAFGDLTHYTTGSTQTVAGGSRTLEVIDQYRSDDRLAGLLRTFSGSGVSSLDVMAQTLSFTSASLPQIRSDTADPSGSRYYSYDALQRLTCEVRGGTGADCMAGSNKLAALLSYFDGANLSAPPDTRSTAYIQQASYHSSSPETYTYSGSGKPLSVQRGTDALVLEHDDIGRRTAEYLDVGSPDSIMAARRQYSYLLNGQLGMVRGLDANGQPYAVSIRYSENGQPITISYAPGDQYELFWDADEQLIAMSITGTHDVRWHYHYLQGRLIAATRELVATGDVKRFWPVTDERGLIARMVNEAGATYWQAHWDATGWRTIDGTPQPDMWVPFALPGQIILEGTEANSTSGAAVRPPIALNQQRAYDPLFGAFLQPDPTDRTGITTPEGYIYGRANYLESFDGTGARSSVVDELRKQLPKKYRMQFDSSCTNHPAEKLLKNDAAVARILQDIDNCSRGKCLADAPDIQRLRHSGLKIDPASNVGISDKIKSLWKLAMLSGKYYCLSDQSGSIDWPQGDAEAAQEHKEQADKDPRRPWTLWPDGTLRDSTGGRESSFARTNVYLGRFHRETLLSPNFKPNEGGDPGGCWEKTLAHEAFHVVMDQLPAVSIGLDDDDKTEAWGYYVYRTTGDEYKHRGPDGLNAYLKCITCP